MFKSHDFPRFLFDLLLLRLTFFVFVALPIVLTAPTIVFSFPNRTALRARERVEDDGDVPFYPTPENVTLFVSRRLRCELRSTEPKPLLLGRLACWGF